MKLRSLGILLWKEKREDKPMIRFSGKQRKSAGQELGIRWKNMNI